MSRPMRAGPAALVMIVMPSGHEQSPTEPLQDPEEDEHADRVGRRAEGRARREERESEHVEPLRAEAVRGPAGQRDDGRERERVRRDRPRDGGVRKRVGRVGREHLDEGRQGDVDDGDVEDRHDRAEDDDAGHLEDGGVDLVRVRLRSPGLAGRSRRVQMTRVPLVMEMLWQLEGWPSWPSASLPQQRRTARTTIVHPGPAPSAKVYRGTPANPKVTSGGAAASPRRHRCPRPCRAGLTPAVPERPQPVDQGRAAR